MMIKRQEKSSPISLCTTALPRMIAQAVRKHAVRRGLVPMTGCCLLTRAGLGTIAATPLYVQAACFAKPGRPTPREFVDLQ
jgi:hypothetical protein